MQQLTKWTGAVTADVAAEVTTNVTSQRPTRRFAAGATPSAARAALLAIALLFTLGGAAAAPSERPAKASQASGKTATKASKATKPTKATKAVKPAPRKSVKRVRPRGAQEDAFLQARDAFRTGDAARLDRLAGQLKEHDLAAYVEYYQLRMRLAQDDVPALQAFLARQEGELVADRLRGEWLRRLADNGQWPLFDAEWPRLVQPDGDLRCRALLRRHQAGAAGTESEARALVESTAELTPACVATLREFFAAGVLTADDAWDRARRLVEASRPRQVGRAIDFLPEDQRPDARELRRALDEPARYLGAQRAIHGSRADRELALIALARLARNDPRAAADEMVRLENQLSLPERQAAWAHIAWQGAQRHRPEALAWYRATHDAALTVDQHEWSVRAALRAHDWATVKLAIERMPARLAADATWVYWLARATKELGDPAAAGQLFASIAEQPSFYGILASDELDRPVRLPPAAPPVTADELAEIADRPGIQRALAWFDRDLRTEGVAEWSWALRGLTDRQLLAAAELAQRHGVYDRAISAANQTQQEHDFRKRFPTPYDGQVLPASRQQGLDAAWVYGLMRQESRFVNQARSGVGAAGLMQLMPGTARWVARKIGLKAYRAERVTEPEINLTLGTSYLRMVQESLDNHPLLASAAYNAGPSRARLWRDAERSLEGAIYAETIPFSETRDYVKKVMSNAIFYSLVFNRQPASLKAQLGMIAPKDAGKAAEAEDLP